MDKHNTRYMKDGDGQWWFLLGGGRRTRAQLWTCAQCGVEFPGYLKRVNCSRKCAGLRKRVGHQPKIGTCVCGRAFQRRGNQKFCGHSCAATAMHARRTKTTDGFDATGLVNGDNPHFTLDEQGQWWYLAGKSASRTRAYIKKCQHCGRPSLRSIFHRTKYCSRRCGVLAAAARGNKAKSGAESHLWNGGKIKRNGYVLVHAPDHPLLKGTTRRYVLEHRLVMEETLGRLLTKGEVVHHLNGVKDDNRPENLELWVKGHPPGQREDERMALPDLSGIAAAIKKADTPLLRRQYAEGKPGDTDWFACGHPSEGPAGAVVGRLVNGDLVPLEAGAQQPQGHPPGQRESDGRPVVVAALAEMLDVVECSLEVHDPPSLLELFGRHGDHRQVYVDAVNALKAAPHCPTCTCHQGEAS